MKKFFKSSILIGLFLSIGISMSSCLSDSYVPNRGGGGISEAEQRGLTIRLTRMPNTRGEYRPIPDGEELMFNTGHIYLLCSAGMIRDRFEVTARGTGAATDLDNRIINRANFDGGQPVTLLGVSGSVTEVLIVGNTPTALSVGLGIETQMGANPLNIITQHNPMNVNLFGRGGLTPVYDINNDRVYNIRGGYRFYLYNVAVHLAPTVARFEITDITGSGRIGNFTVAGIYVDHYFREARVDGMPSNFIFHNTNTAMFFADQPGTSYLSTSNNALFDEPGVTGTAPNNLTVRPATTTLFNGFNEQNVWGYQVFADGFYNPAAPPAVIPTATVAPPRIVVRLTNVSLIDGTDMGTQFLTVSGFRVINSDGTTTPLERIRPSRVYRVPAGGFVFTENDLGDVPNRNEIDVRVQVSLAVWNGVNLTLPGFRQPAPMSDVVDLNETHTFTLGPAVNGDCQVSRQVFYRWEQNTTGLASGWVTAAGTYNLQYYTTAALTQNTWFRRVAFCSCGVEIVTPAALITVNIPFIAVTSITLTGCETGALAPGGQRQLGFTLTPSNASNQNVIWISSNPTVATVNQAGLVTAVAAGTANITVTSECGNFTSTACVIQVQAGIGLPTDTTDPGVVINGVRWATRNLQAPNQFAANPQAHGRFWQWGTASGTNAWEATQAAGVAVPTWNATANVRIAWTSANDPCPAGWRLPTQADFNALNAMGSVWSPVGGQAGRIYPSAGASAAAVTAGTHIFMPAAGWRNNTNGALSSVGTDGLYWSSTPSGTVNAMRLDIFSTSSVVLANNRAFGFSVRCVAE